MRLRISPELWERENDPTLHLRLQRSLNQGTCRILIRTNERLGFQGPTRLVEVESMMLVLRVPSIEPSWDYDIVSYRALSLRERIDFLRSEELREGIIVLSPAQADFESKTGLEMEAIAYDVGVAINEHEFQRLAGHLKVAINHAWGRLQRGRMVRRIYYREGWVLVLFSLDANLERLGEASRGADAALMEEALTEAGVGRTITDDYELKRLRELVEKFGEPLPA